MSTYTLRTLTIADFESAYALWQQTEGIGLNESDSRESIAAFLERNKDLSIVATNKADGKMVGTVLCGHDGRRGYLHHLAVVPEYRRQGIGRALVNGCLDRLASLNIKKCSLFLFASNIPGRTFWLKQGWSTREDIVIAQKVLTP